MRPSSPFVFVLGATFGALTVALASGSPAIAAPPAPGTSQVPCAPSSASPPKPTRAPLPLPPMGEITFDDGTTTSTCTTATVELLDPDSSSPRAILWGDCGTARLSLVVQPTKIPGTATGNGIYGLRLADPKTGQDWRSSDATLTVTTLGKVGDRVEGSFEATMTARLNRDPVVVRGTFRAPRTNDRYRP